MFDKLQETIVYGPVISRRLRKSIGINLFPNDKHKYCSFNCSYCFFKTNSVNIAKGKPFINITSDNVIEDLEFWRTKKSEIFSQSDYLTFSGNGEPIIHPLFPEIIDKVIEWRNTKAPEKKVAIFTNGSRLDIDIVKNAVLRCDDIYIKFDVGTEKDFQSVCRPIESINFSEYIDNIRKTVIEGKSLKKNLTIQAAIIETNLTKNDGVNIHSWASIIKEISPQRVDLYELNLDGTSFRAKEYFNYRNYIYTISKIFENTSIDIQFYTNKRIGYNEVLIQYAVDSLLYLPVYIADKANLFYENGIEPKFLESNDGDLGAIKALINGTTNFALCDPFVVFSDKIPKNDRSKCSLVEIVINRVGLWTMCDGQIRNIADVFSEKEKTYTYPKESTAHKIAEWFNIKKKVIKPNTPGDEFNFACLDHMKNNEDPIDKNAIITADLLTCNVCLRCWKISNTNSTRKILNLSQENSINPFLFTGLIVNTEYRKENPEIVKKVITSINNAIVYFQNGTFLRHQKDEFIIYLIEKISRKSPLFLSCSKKPDFKEDIEKSLEQLRLENIYEPKSLLNVKALINAFHLHNTYNKTISLTEFYKYLKFYNTGNKFRMILLKIFLGLMWFRIKFFPKNRMYVLLILLIGALLSLFMLKYFDNEATNTIGVIGGIASIGGLFVALIWRK